MITPLLKDQVSKYKKYTQVVSAAIFVGEECLMVKRHGSKHNGNKWLQPGGKQEGEESLLETAIRETREETGIELADTKPFAQTSFYIDWRDEGHDWHFMLTLILFKLDEKPEVTSAPNEVTDHAWVRLSDVYDNPDMPLVREQEIVHKQIEKVFNQHAKIK